MSVGGVGVGGVGSGVGGGVGSGYSIPRSFSAPRHRNSGGGKQLVRERKESSNSASQDACVVTVLAAVSGVVLQSRLLSRLFRFSEPVNSGDHHSRGRGW